MLNEDSMKIGADAYWNCYLPQALDEAGIKHVFYESPGTADECQTWGRDPNHLRHDCL
jgi:hypothetical protein